GDDVVSVQSRHPAPASLLHEVGGLEAEAKTEDAIAGRRAAAALDVAEHGRAGLHPGAGLDLLRDRLSDGPVLDTDMAEVVDLALVGDARELTALARDDHREVLATRAAALDRGRDVVEVDFLLRDEDVVGSARDAGEEGDPAGVPPHRLDDEDP